MGTVLRDVSQTSITLEMIAADNIYRELKQEIVTCAIAPGSSLSESELCRRHNASRTPVREACRKLGEDGLLRIVPFRGYFVAPLTVAEYHNLHEVQLAVDSTAAELASQRASEAEIKQIEHWAKYQYRVGVKNSYYTFLEWNRNLHVGIAEASGNDILAQIAADIQTRLMRYFYLVISMDSYGAELVQEHRHIVAAIRARDAERAGRCAAEHVRRTIERSRNLFVAGHARLGELEPELAADVEFESFAPKENPARVRRAAARLRAAAAD